jgi:hypothetical protein
VIHVIFAVGKLCCKALTAAATMTMSPRAEKRTMAMFKLAGAVLFMFGERLLSLGGTTYLNNAGKDECCHYIISYGQGP